MALDNKTAVVTGISKGIGRSVTRALLDRGVKVVGWGLNNPPYSHRDLFFVECNVRQRESVEAAFKETLLLLDNRIDFLINNAGLGYFGPFEQTEPEHFAEMFEVNVYGIYYTCRSIIPLMKKQGSGHIVNISSIAGLQDVVQGAAYSGAKHAVRGITESLFRELRDNGIKVSGIYPGSVQTDFFDNAPGMEAHSMMMQPDDVAEQVVRVLDTPQNFLINSIVFRPLQVKK